MTQHKIQIFNHSKLLRNKFYHQKCLQNSMSSSKCLRQRTQLMRLKLPSLDCSRRCDKTPMPIRTAKPMPDGPADEMKRQNVPIRTAKTNARWSADEIKRQANKSNATGWT
ncbi:hypothetical protein GPALN_010129 [Globodera pallida]|nr:hypothetical protein GPALN_010129 [Globodera pallida]